MTTASAFPCAVCGDHSTSMYWVNNEWRCYRHFVTTNASVLDEIGTLKDALASERARREQAERERDELGASLNRQLCELQRRLDDAEERAWCMKCERDELRKDRDDADAAMRASERDASHCRTQAADMERARNDAQAEAYRLKVDAARVAKDLSEHRGWLCEAGLSLGVIVPERLFDVPGTAKILVAELQEARAELARQATDHLDEMMTMEARHREEARAVRVPDSFRDTIRAALERMGAIASRVNNPMCEAYPCDAALAWLAALPREEGAK